MRTEESKRGSVTLETALIFPIIILLIAMFITSFINNQVEVAADLKKDDQCVKEWREGASCSAWK